MKDTNYWVPIAPRGDAYLSVYRSHARKPSIGAFVGLYNDPLTFVSERLIAQREELEMAFGAALDWSRNREGVMSKIVARIPVADPNDRADWPRQHAWMVDHLIRMERVFGPLVTEALASYEPGASAA